MRILLGSSALAALLACTACPTDVAPPPGGKEGEGEPAEGEGEGEGGKGVLDVARSSLSVDPAGPLPADGIATYTITIHLEDGAAQPMPGVAVTLASDLGTLTQPAATDENGEATATLSSTDVGTASLTATVDDAQLAPLTVEFEGCRTPAQAFEQELYPKVFSKCQGCHNELGLARLNGLSYVLPFPGVDDWAQRSVDIISLQATTFDDTTEGTQLSRIVSKPMNLDVEGHLGGEVIHPGSEEERLLKAFAEKLNNPDACSGVDDRADAALSRITVLSPRETYARAKIALTGALATPEELAAMEDTEAALDAKLDELMGTAAFETRVVELYADWFLTDRFTKVMGGRRVLNRNSQFTKRFFYAAEGTGTQQCDPATDDCCSEHFTAEYCAGKEDALIDTLAREPMEMIRRVVKNEQPISNAITLDHTFVTPLSATFYGFTTSEQAALFDADLSNDATETAQAQLHKTANNTLGGGPASVSYPHAGILTSHAMLGRWPSTTSNKNRGRAQSIVMRRLLNIDVMKFAEFSTASLAPDADLESATQNEIACTVCHSAVDPLAVLWQHFQNAGQYMVNAPSSATDNMPEPEIMGDVLAADDPTDPILFLADHVVQHERFPLAMLMPVLQGLTGFQELDNNIDPLDPLVEEKALAAEIQHKLLSTLRARFANEHALRVKPMIKDVIKSELFRAKSADTASLTDLEKKALELAGVGRGVMITPEQLNRKISSLVGFEWRVNRSPTGKELLLDLNQYRILFGGINYDSIAKRFRDPSPVLTRIVERMGNEVACIAVPQDFSLSDKAQRRLFQNVEITDDDPALVRAELKRLHKLILEEDVDDGDPELEASVALFNDALAQGRQLVANGDADDQLRSDCRATQSFEATPVTYPAAGHIRLVDDPDYIIRAWMVTVSYLLTDPRFFID
jgi:hypothetical protein